MTLKLTDYVERNVIKIPYRNYKGSVFIFYGQCRTIKEGSNILVLYIKHFVYCIKYLLRFMLLYCTYIVSFDSGIFYEVSKKSTPGGL